MPKSNLDYWLPKLERNTRRDERNAAALAIAGWLLIDVWEHEDVGLAADRVQAVIEERTSL